MPVNSPLNQPLTMFTATRPLVSWSIVASCLATTAGCQGPGRIAAITLSFSVAASRAWLMATDSCWYSAP
ncbi:hypothetical protein PAERUG_P54_1_London_24_VIM_2_04_13_05788 [Pseudomonas aeruginosa]|jgi:hypothetical protein|nr:hypothetical protein PAERUG_P54_1_London_24_VIM_2_04_13_05788 [Pseudomonas aeruginosa]